MRSLNEKSSDTEDVLATPVNHTIKVGLTAKNPTEITKISH
jgi:hypothetical protein